VMANAGEPIGCFVPQHEESILSNNTARSGIFLPHPGTDRPQGGTNRVSLLAASFRNRSFKDQANCKVIQPS